ncbi:hypothetical protein ATL40_2891 [Serinibacter salmoneus]|uniref:Uncharacterized protein n=2 Tax=Serinibacter salmoneus TaxID=556530 RepID=A0A2A9D4T3_9MICO|nr:hypothetical protein ATL40_2891 [Serinibacter salmoneus]
MVPVVEALPLDFPFCYRPSMTSPSDKRVLRVFADYGASTPLWGAGLIEDLDALGLSLGLQQTLRETAEVFNDSVVPELGWKSEQRRHEYMRLLDESVKGLTAELGSRCTIIKE